MQIVVRQISGLGNQLFQYAAGLYYARRYSATVRMAIDPARHALSHGCPRPFLLDRFSISLPFQEITRLDRLILTQRPILRPASYLLRKTLGIEVFTEQISQRYTFLRDLPVEPTINILYLVGYWQTYRLVDAVADELRRDLTFKEAARGKTLDVLKQIEQSSEPVSLHIRRGDYTLAAEGNIALPIDYYKQAITLLRERLRNPTFFVFSDDMEFARTQLPREAKAVFVDHNDDTSSHEDLRLMSSCQHHVIANSTFSWWGAWMNPRPDKVVVAPHNWHLRPGSFFPDLLPPEWLLADSSGNLLSSSGVALDSTYASSAE